MCLGELRTTVSFAPDATLVPLSLWVNPYGLLALKGLVIRGGLVTE